MGTITFLVKLKKPTRRKRQAFLRDQMIYSEAINWCVEELKTVKKLTSKNVPFKLKSALKNEAIRRAKKAHQDVKTGQAKTIPTFKSSTPVSINNQNWDVKQKNGRWYIGFTSSLGKKYYPVMETKQVHTFFPYFMHREFRGTLQLLRKGEQWFVALPVQTSSEWKTNQTVQQTPIGVDLGLRHIAVVSEPNSGKRQFYSGKEVGYKRRHFRSLRRSLGKKKAQRAIERVGQKENRWITDHNRKLAVSIVDFARQFEYPIIKLEELDDIRKTCKSMKRADKTIHSWAFYQLKTCIKERAAKFNIPVRDINPYKTSQKCSSCGYTNKKNRSRDRFHCLSCGFQNHADLNASYNIARA